MSRDSQTAVFLYPWQRPPCKKEFRDRCSTSSTDFTDPSHGVHVLPPVKGTTTPPHHTEPRGLPKTRFGSAHRATAPPVACRCPGGRVSSTQDEADRLLQRRQIRRTGPRVAVPTERRSGRRRNGFRAKTACKHAYHRQYGKLSHWI